MTKTLLLAAALLAPSLALSAPSKLSPSSDKAIALEAEKTTPTKQKGTTATTPAPEKPAPRPTRPAHLFM